MARWRVQKAGGRKQNGGKDNLSHQRDTRQLSTHYITTRSALYLVSALSHTQSHSVEVLIDLIDLI
jgi:hypothetical protein